MLTDFGAYPNWNPFIGSSVMETIGLEYPKRLWADESKTKRRSWKAV